MKHIITVSVVNFHPEWGKKDINLQKIKDYIEIAGAQGSNLVIFPEMALTGYDVEVDTPKDQLMQIREAETIPGPSSLEIAKIAQETNAYVVFGMPERDKENPQIVYNSVAIISPDGSIDSYQKMHCFGDENKWATKGHTPKVLQTPWGPLGISICYDTFNYPELLRFARALGARMHISCTANSIEASHEPLIRTELEGMVLQNWYYVASANLCGHDLHDYFFGGSSVLGPSAEGCKPHYYAGHPYYSEEGQEIAMYTAAIDLHYADDGVLPIFKTNSNVGEPDFMPQVYEEMMRTIQQQPRWQEQFSE